MTLFSFELHNRGLLLNYFGIQLQGIALHCTAKGKVHYFGDVIHSSNALRKVNLTKNLHLLY